MTYYKETTYKDEESETYNIDVTDTERELLFNCGMEDLIYHYENKIELDCSTELEDAIISHGIIKILKDKLNTSCK